MQYDNVLMEEAAQILEVETFVPESTGRPQQTQEGDHDRGSSPGRTRKALGGGEEERGGAGMGEGMGGEDEERGGGKEERVGSGGGFQNTTFQYGIARDYSALGHKPTQILFLM